MSDDAQTPEVPENTGAYPPTPPGEAEQAPWETPVDPRQAPVRDTAPKVPLAKSDQPVAGDGPEPNPWAPPVNDAPAGPGATIADLGPLTPPPAAVHDQRTITSPADLGGTPPADAPQPWASPFAPPNPSAPANGGPYAPPSPTAPSNGTGNPFAPPAPVNGQGNPFAPPGPSTPANGPAGPFAPPAAPYAHGEPVPPPPIAPDGPGQVPYGYPGGGYGYPAQPSYGGQGTHGPLSQGAGAGAGAYYGWPGLSPQPSNGLGTASLVLGIISVAIFCLWPIAILLGILALIFGMIGRGKAARGEATNAGQALAGIICGAVGMVLGFVLLALVIAT